MKKIGIEKGLTPVRDFLASKGYSVSEIDLGSKGADTLGSFDAIVVTGLNDNVMGIQTTSTKAPIIEAYGMKPEDIQMAIEREIK